MKKYLLLIISSALILSFGCGKQNKKQYSYWYMNNDSFKTNDVKATIGKARADILSDYSSNYFSIVFNSSYLPTDGSFRMKCYESNSAFVCVAITYNNISYVPDSVSANYLTATQQNCKAQYILQPTWFKNESNIHDSVLVRGTFNEP